MAASGKRSWKTSVFWTKDADDQDQKIVKLHMPGVILEPDSNVKAPMVRKPVYMINPRVVTLQSSLRNSLEKRKGSMDTSSHASLTKSTMDSAPLTQGHRHDKEQEQGKKQLSLKELNPQDKKRVANLVKELAKVGEERVNAEERLQAERTAFEERLVILQEEYDAVIKEKQYLQKRFLELQALLVKYQANGKTPSPRKPFKSPPNEDKENQQISGVILSSPSKHASPLKAILTETPGNTRRVASESAMDGTVDRRLKKEAGLQPHLTSDARTDLLEPLNNSGQLGKITAATPPLHYNRSSSTHARESSPGKMNTVEDRLVATGTGTTLGLPVTKPSNVQEIPQRSALRVGLLSSSMNPCEASTNASQAETAHVPLVTNSQPEMRAEPAMMSQHPPQTKPILDGGSEPKAEWRLPTRKNEDRSFSEASGISGSFSAELDAVYRLYCREYELQLQLQQQQIELQRQQLQLQQQLQQVEALQQQQQKQQQQQQQLEPQRQHQHQQQQQPGRQCAEHVVPPSQGVVIVTHKQELKTVVEETPSPSLVPRPSSQPRQVLPAQCLIPTPEGSSSIATNNLVLPSTDLHTPRTESLSRDHAPAVTNEVVLPSSGSRRMKLQTENRGGLDRAMSAPPNFDHSRPNFKQQLSGHQQNTTLPAGRSKRGSAVLGYATYSANDNPHTIPPHNGGIPRTNFHSTDASITRYSLHSQNRDLSSNSLRERGDLDLYSEPDMFSGRVSSDLFYTSSTSEVNSARNTSSAERFQQQSLLSKARPPFPDVQRRESFSGEDQRFLLHSEAQVPDEVFPRDDVVIIRDNRKERREDSKHLNGAYPLSLVDIVDGLENITEKPEESSTNPELAGGLDTTDSGYSQDTYKEGSPLASESVNSDEEEAAVLEDIFFRPGRV